MGDLEIVANIDKIKSHAGYLSSMIDAIFFGDPRDHHVWNVRSYSIRTDSEGKEKDDLITYLYFIQIFAIKWVYSIFSIFF